MRLGIDFGTTRTVVAVADDGRYPVVTFELGDELRDHLPGTATAVGEALRFGVAGHAAPRPTWAIASVKRALGKAAPDDPVPGRPRTTVLELTTAYLRWLRTMLLEHSSIADELDPGAPIEAMVAVPAQASTRQRYVTLEAYRRAGFSVLGVLNEPTAAAIEYALHHRNAMSSRSPKEYVLVYDLGGGTFDTAAVSLRGRHFELLASDGIAQLGGEDFDDLIVARALRRARVGGAEPDTVARVAVGDRAREAKEGLRPGSRKLLVDLSALGEEPVVLDATEVYLEARPLIDRTIACVEALLEDLGARGVDIEDARKLGALYLVGGSSAYVPVARALRERFGRKILLAPQPHAATAVGLAVAADAAAGVFVREAATRFFGVWREADDGRDKVFDAILNKGVLPADGAAVVERRYRPTHRIGHLRFLECSALGPDGQPRGDLTPWQEIRFPYDPALRDLGELGAVPIERHRIELDADIVETYTHAPDGTVEVAIENRTHGYRRAYPLGMLR